MIRLGILICDHVNETLQEEFDSYPTMFDELLKENRDDFIVKYFFVVDGIFPENVDACDVYMVNGSKSSANDDDPWIVQLEKFIVDLYQAKKPLVGICFGHQLLAKALGGVVEKSEKGWGIGIHTSKLTQQKSWMNNTLQELNLIMSHQDQIKQLPKDTEVLYSNDFCPFSMIQVGDNFIGIQGHPEFTPQYSEALMKLRKKIIPSDVINEGKQSLQQSANSAEVIALLLNFFRSRF